MVEFIQWGVNNGDIFKNNTGYSFLGFDGCKIGFDVIELFLDGDGNFCEFPCDFQSPPFIQYYLDKLCVIEAIRFDKFFDFIITIIVNNPYIFRTIKVNLELDVVEI
jgi:hypothetical protein